jgi:hypothetical protein
MNSVIFRYGIIAAFVVLLLGFINCLIIQPYVGLAASEVGGYLSIAVSMIFVFLGIRYYRNHVNKGTLSFGKGMKVGTLIVLVPSVAFGLFSVLYSRVINPNFKAEYYALKQEELKASVPPEELANALAKMERQAKMFDSVIAEFLVMAITVFVIGLIVSIISALALRRSQYKTA